MLLDESASALPEIFLSSVCFAEAISNRNRKSDSAYSGCMEMSKLFSPALLL